MDRYYQKAACDVQKIHKGAFRGHFRIQDAADEVVRRPAKQELGHHCLRQHRTQEISFSRHPLLGNF